MPSTITPPTITCPDWCSSDHRDDDPLGAYDHTCEIGEGVEVTAADDEDGLHPPEIALTQPRDGITAAQARALNVALNRAADLLDQLDQ